MSGCDGMLHVRVRSTAEESRLGWPSSFKVEMDREGRFCGVGSRNMG